MAAPATLAPRLIHSWPKTAIPAKVQEHKGPFLNVILGLVIAILGILGMSGVLPQYSVSVGGCFVGLGILSIVKGFLSFQHARKVKEAVKVIDISLLPQEVAQQIKPGDAPVDLDYPLFREANVYQIAHAATELVFCIGMLVMGILGVSSVLPMKMASAGILLGGGVIFAGLAIYRLHAVHKVRIAVKQMGIDRNSAS